MEGREVLCEQFAAALSYPSADFHARTAAIAESLGPLTAEGAAQARRFAAAITDMPVTHLQEVYTQTFDMNPRCSLETGWHAFGESPDRAQFLAWIRGELKSAGVAETTELPDHMTHVLRLMGRAPSARAAEIGAFAASALERIAGALSGRQNPYEHLIRSALATVRAMTATGSERTTGE
jgi:nitrate reductase delta subunit